MKYHRKIQVAAMLMTLTLTGTVLGQGMSFQELLSGKTVPLTLKLKDLNDEWRRINLGGSSGGAGALAIYSAMFGGGLGGGVYYTKGQTVTVGGETYLVAYRAQTKSPDMASMQQLMRSGQMPEPEKPTAQTTLSLSLLNLRTTGSFNDIRPFNLEFELTGNETALATEGEKRAQEVNDASLSNLRKLGTALLTYERDRKVLPLLTDVRTAQEELVLYVSSKDVFAQPETKKPYQPNPSLSGKKLADIAKPEKTVVFYEATASPDGTRGVLFLDGHADRIPENNWKRIKQDSQFP
jgi:hypothetical protein